MQGILKLNMTAPLPIIPACLLHPSGTLPGSASPEDVRYSYSAEDYLSYLGADATPAQKYEVRMWWGSPVVDFDGLPHSFGMATPKLCGALHVGEDDGYMPLWRM